MGEEFIRSSKESDNDYVEKNIWTKIKKTASKVPFIPDVIAMYYCAMDSNTPIHIKVAAFSALAYFVSPIDIIPDAIPLAGYGDDVGVIANAMTLMSQYITDEHRRKAKEWLKGKE